MTAQDEVARAIGAIWRMESPRIIARVARMLRNVGVAEEIAQEAWLIALQQWPRSGLPVNPGAWLMTTARNRAIDEIRRQKLAQDNQGVLALDADTNDPGEPDVDSADVIADDLLRLIFVACHPVLGREARVALTLRLLGGLSSAEIARAYLVSEAAIQQRIVRAKRTLSEAHVPFEVPSLSEREQRLNSVLDVIYLIFNEGYAATSGTEWTRPALCEEALRLGRILAELMPDESEVHGLVALMELQASRLPARTSPKGEPILLPAQNRLRWDRLLINRGLAALARAEAGSGAWGPYALQAAIAACHARASTADATDWERILALYDALYELAPSPVVALNRAVAVSMTYGPKAALELVDELIQDGRLRNYHLLASVRGDLLEKLGRLGEARIEFANAAALSGNSRERDLLLHRLAALQCQDLAGD